MFTKELCYCKGHTKPHSIHLNNFKFHFPHCFCLHFNSFHLKIFFFFKLIVYFLLWTVEYPIEWNTKDQLMIYLKLLNVYIQKFLISRKNKSTYWDIIFFFFNLPLWVFHEICAHPFIPLLCFFFHCFSVRT